MREVKTIPLLTGSCRHPEFLAIRDGSWRPIDFPAVAMLILHPDEGAILFDTGYDPAFLAASEPFPERLYRWATPIEFAAGMDSASLCRMQGIDPTSVRHLVLSHFHGDHIAGAHAFPSASIHCSRAGLRHARQGSRLTRIRRGILDRLIPANIDIRARHFEEAPRIALPPELQPFEDGADILGDGSLLAVELPGHCPGHWGLLLRDSRWGLHFLVADAAWSLDAIRRNAPPSRLATSLLGNTQRTRTTLHQLHLLQCRNPEIRLTPYHCAERAAEVDAQ